MASKIQCREEAERLYYEGVELVASGEASMAAAKFRESVAIDPTFLDALHGLIRALQNSGEFDQAIAAARDLIALDPDDTLAHTSLSILYQHQGMVPEAEAEALKAKLLGWKLELRQLQATPSTE